MLEGWIQTKKLSAEIEFSFYSRMIAILLSFNKICSNLFLFRTKSFKNYVKLLKTYGGKGRECI